jgi:hypothetical protein
VEIRTAQVERVEIEMEASPDTGFELTSQPPGGLVWLDGQAFVINETGKQATTNFRASRITPGRHVLEIKGDPRFKDWHQEIFQEPGQTLKINAARESGGAGVRRVRLQLRRQQAARACWPKTEGGRPVRAAQPGEPGGGKRPVTTAWAAPSPREAARLGTRPGVTMTSSKMREG